MTRPASVVLGIVALGGIAAAPTSAQSAKAAPTYNRDVAPILHRSCTACHRPNQVAPMSLLTYQDARPWAKAIKAKVRDREMPPWFADPKYGKFANDRSLTPAEIDLLSAWADAGAPQGAGPAPHRRGSRRPAGVILLEGLPTSS